MNATVFYPLRAPASLLIFWILMGMVVPIASLTTVPMVVALLALPILITAYRYYMSHYYANIAFSIGDGDYFTKALKLDPNNSCYLMSIIEIVKKVDPVQAAHVSYQCLSNYDGDTVPWAIWTNLGHTRLATGQIVEARMCFIQALSSLPYYKPALKGLEQCEKVLKEGGQIVIQFHKEKPNGLQNNGSEHSKIRS
jgi:tetratricopeptide (TPR) repeat protein